MPSPAFDLRHTRLAILLALCGLWLAAPAAAHFVLRFQPVPAYSDTPVTLELELLEEDGCAWSWQPDPGQAGPAAAGGTIRFFLRYDCFIEPGPARIATGELDLGLLAAGRYVVEFVDDENGRIAVSGTFEVFDRPPCTPSDTTLCLRDGRFGAAVAWTDFVGTRGPGHAVPRDPAVPFRADTGFVWFFDPGNLELMIKVLDGCALNGHYWVFISPGSTVEYAIHVTDHAAGLTRTYANPSGAVPKLFADTSAFPCG